MRLVQYPKPRPMLPRAEATRLLGRVIARAAEVNLDPQRFPFAVGRLFVFGSYLGDKEILGDLDLAVDLMLVRPLSELGRERPEWLAHHWANRTYAALQMRKPKLISIHSGHGMRGLDTPWEQIFEDDNRLRKLLDS